MKTTLTGLRKMIREHFKTLLEGVNRERQEKAGYAGADGETGVDYHDLPEGIEDDGQVQEARPYGNPTDFSKFSRQPGRAANAESVIKGIYLYAVKSGQKALLDDPELGLRRAEHIRLMTSKQKAACFDVFMHLKHKGKDGPATAKQMATEMYRDYGQEGDDLDQAVAKMDKYDSSPVESISREKQERHGYAGADNEAGVDYDDLSEAPYDTLKGFARHPGQVEPMEDDEMNPAWGDEAEFSGGSSGQNPTLWYDQMEKMVASLPLGAASTGREPSAEPTMGPRKMPPGSQHGWKKPKMKMPSPAGKSVVPLKKKSPGTESEAALSPEGEEYVRKHIADYEKAHGQERGREKAYEKAGKMKGGSTKKKEGPKSKEKPEKKAEPKKKEAPKKEKSSKKED